MSRKKRDAPISYRPPEKLRDEFHARVANSGMSLNAYITASVFGQAAPRKRRKPAIDHQVAAILLSQAARIADRLGPPRSSDDPLSVLLVECRDELIEIRTCLMQVLGREP